MPNTTNDTNENKITLLKRTKEEGKAPNNLQYGEIAINYHEGTEQLYIQNHSDKVVPLIPKKISDLEGSSDYITEEDLEEYTYDKQEISDMISTATGGGIVAVNATGISPLSLTASVSNGAANISGSVDMTGYATTAEIPTKVSQLTNDSGYITNSALNNYYDKDNAYSKTEVDNKLSSCITKVTATGTSPLTLGVDTTSGEVNISGSVDLTDYAKKTDIPTKVSDLTNDSNYIKSVELNTGTSNLQYVITVDGTSIGTIDIPASQVLTGATYTEGYLILTFTIDGQSEEVKVNLTDLINAYTNGNGLDLSNNQFSIKISSSSEGYLVVNENGLSITGIDYALSQKQDKLEAGDNITITQDTTSGNLTISAKDTIYSAGTNVSIGTDNVISATDTTYSEATTSSAGLMSASDKTTLNSLSSNAITSVTATGTAPLSLSGSISNNQLTITGGVGMATASSLGTVKPYYVETPYGVSIHKVSARQYAVGMNSSGELYTCVPWVDTIYTSTGTNVDIDNDEATITVVNTEWNYYRFEGSSSESTVTIDGSSVSVPANAVVEGNFTEDISAIDTNNLKKIKIKGDVSLTIGSDSSNSTVEEVDIEFSTGYSRSLNSMFHNLRVLKSLRLRGGQPTSCDYMCHYMAFIGTTPCVVDIKDVDFSKCTTCYCMFHSASYVQSLDLSGNDFSSVTESSSMWGSCTHLQTLNLSGCNFSSVTTLSSRWSSCTHLQTLNLSGCNFSSVTSLSSMCSGCTNLQTLNLSGCDFSSVTSLSSMCSNCTNLQFIIGPFTLTGVNLTSTNIASAFHDCPLTRESALSIFNALPSKYTGGTYYQLQLSNTTLSQLTTDDLALIHSKGWVATEHWLDDTEQVMPLSVTGFSNPWPFTQDYLSYWFANPEVFNNVNGYLELINYDDNAMTGTLRVHISDGETQTFHLYEGSETGKLLGHMTLTNNSFLVGQQDFNGFFDIKIILSYGRATSDMYTVAELDTKYYVTML